MTDEAVKPEGRARGGHARARALSPEQRAESARQAALARWSREEDDIDPKLEDEELLEPEPAMPIARWRGTLNIVGLEVPCLRPGHRREDYWADLCDRASDRHSGRWGTQKYIGVKALEPFIPIRLVLERMVPFRLLEVEGLERAVKGLPADLMIEVCQGFVAALQASFDPNSQYPRMTDRQRQMAIKASMFLSACAKVGLEALIDEATGYQYERAEDALRVKLRAFIADELRAWEKTFPDELWVEFGRLTGWKGSLHSRPKWWGRLIIEMIYNTLDPDVANYLRENKPPPGVHWHRQLTDNIGVRALVSRCYEVVGMAKDCTNMRELRDKVARHYGREMVQFTLALPALERGP